MSGMCHCAWIGNRNTLCDWTTAGPVFMLASLFCPLTKEALMKKYIQSIAALVLSTFTAALWAADAEYVAIDMEIDINKSAADVWAAVGDYCDIAEWGGLACVITSGDGGMGTVRELTAGPRKIIEILVARTELSYGYTQPVQEGQFYNLYHGFMEARPVTANTSKMLYTLVYDVSNLDGQAAKEADMARRRTMFENMLKNMKEIAEAN